MSAEPATSSAPIPADEAARLAALRRYRILDTEPERCFDDLTLLASHICGTPMALLSLVDAERQWFKSRIGIPLTETSRAVSFCGHAIQHRDLFIVTDAAHDVRFHDNPLVTGGPEIRFYAGAPLVTPDGHALGTLCVLDHVARTLTRDQLEALSALCRQAESQLELRKNLMDLADALAERDKAQIEQAKLITDLRAAHADVRRLSGLMPFCSTCQLTMTIPADPAAIPTVTDGVIHVLQEKGWPEADVMAVELALQEAVANAIRHGCAGDASKELQCSVTVDTSGEVVITVRDSGTGFDPAKVANPLDPANLLKSSGRGIFLISGLMDSVEFADGGRELQMRKRVSGDLEGR
jgi:anti-sigma regulatory factor (Ser/Thr protein kinase)